jgi:hypothetical protein
VGLFNLKKQMISKHVEELLELLRENYRNIKCIESQYDSFHKLEIEVSNLYPEKNGEEIFGLSNNKSLTTDDFEFADVKKINGKQIVFLGNYRFFFEDGVFNI